MISIQDLSKDFFKALPKDILLYILTFSYKVQNSELLEDIRNFVETKNNICMIYFERNKDLLEYEPNADKNWLVNDILVFNKIHVNMDIYKKMRYLLNEYIFLKKNIHFQFNKFWSMLTPFKRSLFVKIRTPPFKKNQL
jgi:hypothetical protein